jgi:hypothetical protein
MSGRIISLCIAAAFGMAVGALNDQIMPTANEFLVLVLAWIWRVVGSYADHECGLWGRKQ